MMSFVERVNQGESLASWLNWLTEPPAVCWSVIMGDLSWKGVYWTLPKAFRTGPPICAVHGMRLWKQSETWSSLGNHGFYVPLRLRQWVSNSLRAKFFRGKINIYLHFMSLLHIDMTQALKILPHVKPGSTYNIVNIMAVDVLAK